MNVFPPGQVVPRSHSSEFSINIGDEAHIVERAAIVQIKQYLEQECERQEAAWLVRDQEFAFSMGVRLTPGIIERVLPQNFFVGARPSLVGTTIDFWPSITARVGDGRPSSEQFDQFDVIDMDLYIEVLCKSGPVSQERIQLQEGIDAEGEVNKQVQRLSAAVHMCIRRDPTLGANVQPIQLPPVKHPSFPFPVAGTDGEGTGDYWIYAGKQLRYVVQANSY